LSFLLSYDLDPFIFSGFLGWWLAKGLKEVFLVLLKFLSFCYTEKNEGFFREVREMNGYHDNIEEITLENENFRRVLFTGDHSQLVVMAIVPGEEIGQEVHSDVDQFFRFESGEGRVTIDSEEFEVGDGDAVIVPAGSEHNVINVSASESLKLYTIYSPANHPAGTVHKTKAEADKYEEARHH
jgi:mannose-6-phosphate isomerase-like protein (cupin superfamily)